MALHIYTDAAKTNQLSEGTGTTPDTVHGSGTVGFDHVLDLYVGSSTSTRFYGDQSNPVQITAENEGDGITITYALDNNGTPVSYQEVLELGIIAAAGASGDPKKIWRKVTVPAETDSITKTTIKHVVSGIEYIV